MVTRPTDTFGKATSYYNSGAALEKLPFGGLSGDVFSKVNALEETGLSRTQGVSYSEFLKNLTDGMEMGNYDVEGSSAPGGLIATGMGASLLAQRLQVAREEEDSEEAVEYLMQQILDEQLRQLQAYSKWLGNQIDETQEKINAVKEKLRENQAKIDLIDDDLTELTDAKDALAKGDRKPIEALLKKHGKNPDGLDTADLVILATQLGTDWEQKKAPLEKEREGLNEELDTLENRKATLKSEKSKVDAAIDKAEVAQEFGNAASYDEAMEEIKGLDLVQKDEAIRLSEGKDEALDRDVSAAYFGDYSSENDAGSTDELFAAFSDNKETLLKPEENNVPQQEVPASEFNSEFNG